MSAPSDTTHVQRIARSGSLNVVGAGLSAVAGFGLTLVLTNGLSQAVAGTVFATTSLFLIITAFVQLGTESGMARWLPVKLATGRADQLGPVLRAGLVPVVVVSTLAAVALALLSPVVAGLLVDGADLPTVTTQLRILAVFLPLAATLNVVLAATRGLRTIHPTVLVESIGRSVLQLAVVAGVTLLGGGAELIVLAWAGPYLFALLVAVVWLLVLLRRIRDSGRRDPVATDPVASGGQEEPGVAATVTAPSPAREFWSYTGPRAVATVAQTLLKRSDVIMVAALRSPSEAAVYAAASRFVTLGQVAVQALQQALAPQLSSMFARDEQEHAQEVFQVTTTWSIMLAWPVYIGCAVLAPVVLLLFGEGYTEGASVVVLLSAAMLVAVASGSVDTVVLMSGRSWLSLGNTLAAVAVNVVLNLLLIPPYGIEGAAVAWTAAIVVRNVLPLLQIRRALGMSPFGASSALVAGSSFGLLAVVPGALVLLGVGMGWVVLALAVGGVCYAAVLLLARRRLHLAELVRSLRRGPGRRAGTRSRR